MSGNNKGSKRKGPQTKRRKSTPTNVKRDLICPAHGDPRPSRSSVNMNPPHTNGHTPSASDPSSGPSSSTIPSAESSSTSRYAFLCFKKRSPSTLVNGTYRAHDPNSLPEPLKWGFIHWASQQKGRTKPLEEAENLYNNRTLRYWRLSTDYGRFIKHEETEGGATNQDVGGDIANEVVNGTNVIGLQPQQTPPAPLFWTSPQRPYTAPPHQMNRSRSYLSFRDDRSSRNFHQQ